LVNRVTSLTASSPISLKAFFSSEPDLKVVE
jgi:hypothetical protein